MKAANKTYFKTEIKVSKKDNPGQSYCQVCGELYKRNRRFLMGHYPPGLHPYAHTQPAGLTSDRPEEPHFIYYLIN